MYNDVLVSVAIPAYKARFLNVAIESVIKQTHTKWELIIVDDCSPDDIKNIVDLFSDDRIRYIVNKKNLGKENPARNWNQCLKYAKGKFFALLCDDDYYAPTFIEKMLNLAENYPDCNVFRTRGCIVDQYGETIQKYPPSPKWETAENYIISVIQGDRKQTISEFMYRTQRLRECGGYSYLPLAWHADYLSVFKFGLVGGIASSDYSETLLSFRMSGHNISSQDSINAYEKILATKLYLDELRSICTTSKFDSCNSLFQMFPQFSFMHNDYRLRRASKMELLKILLNSKKLGVDRSLVLKSMFMKRLK